MKLEVFGTGCARCHQLGKHVAEAVRETGIAAEIVRVDDIVAIMERGIIFTPALAIDGETKVSGRVPSVREIRELLTEGAWTIQTPRHAVVCGFLGGVGSEQKGSSRRRGQPTKDAVDEAMAMKSATGGS